MPLPRGVEVFSRWVHVTTAAEKDFQASPTAQSDELDGSVLQWGADAYRPQGVMATDPKVEAYVSPLHRPSKLPLPLYVYAGTVEGFCGQIAEFVEEMSEVDGNQVLFRSTEFVPHNLLVTHEAFGKTKDLEEALDEA